MEPEYVHLLPTGTPPQLPRGPLRVIIVSDSSVNHDWRNGIAKSLVDGGCLYAVAWGTECEQWHDAVDQALLEIFDYGDIPDEKFVMTSWHSDVSMSEALWFAGHCAFHPDVELQRTVILHVATQAKPDELIALYVTSQIVSGD